MFLYRKLSLQYLLLSSMINLVADDIEIQFIMENSINFQHQTGAEGDFHLPETIVGTGQNLKHLLQTANYIVIWVMEILWMLPTNQVSKVQNMDRA